MFLKEEHHFSHTQNGDLGNKFLFTYDHSHFLQSPVRANLKATFSEVLPESLPQRLTPIIFKAFFGAEKCHQKDLVERQILLLGSSVTTPAEIKMLS